MSLQKIQIAPNKFFKYIKKKGHLTGSSVLGGFTENSDIDIILKKDKFIMSFEDLFTYKEKADQELKDFIQENPEYDDDTHEVAYVLDSNGRVYNLLLFEDQVSIDIWVKTTDTILKMKSDYPIIHHICQNRESRVDLFKLIRTVLRENWSELKNETH